jgi:Ca2+-binding EF-hand superfamily protein
VAKKSKVYLNCKESNMSVSGIGRSGGFDASKMASKIVKELDKNGDGSLDKAEFTKGMAAKGISEVEAAKKFDSIDTKKTGKISQSDIETDIKSNVKQGGGASGGRPPSGGKPGGASESSSTSYDVKDTNKDGTVSAAEELVYEIKHATQSTSKTTESNSSDSSSNSARPKIGSVIDVTV